MILMRNGLERIANFFSQKIELFGGKTEEIDEAWKEWDEEKVWYDKQESGWRLKIPNAKERIQ